KYYQYARLIPRLSGDDYTVDEKTKSASLTEDGIAKVERWTGIKNVYELEHVDEAHQINQALKAYTLFKRDRDYLVKDGEVIIVDEFTGRQQPGRRWADGRHRSPGPGRHRVGREIGAARPVAGKARGAARGAQRQTA